MMANLTKLLEAAASPLDEFLARSNSTMDDLQKSIAAYGDGELTITSPIKPPPADVTVIPCLDIEFSYTLLAQANQAGANARITPSATRFLGESVFQSVKVVPFLSAFAAYVVKAPPLFPA